MDLVSSVTAKGLAVIDSLAGYVAEISGAMLLQTNCYNLTIYNSSLTPCGEGFLQFIIQILTQIPLSVLGYWVSVLQEAIAGLMAI